MSKRLISKKSRMTSAQLERVEIVFDLLPADGSLRSAAEISAVLINDKSYNPKGLSKSQVRSRVAANIRTLELDDRVIKHNTREETKWSREGGKSLLPKPDSKIGMVLAQLPDDGSQITASAICSILFEDEEYNPEGRPKEDLFPLVYRCLENLEKKGLVQRHKIGGRAWWSLEGFGQKLAQETVEVSDDEHDNGIDDSSRLKYSPDSLEGKCLELIQNHQYQYDEYEIGSILYGGESFDKPTMTELPHDKFQAKVEDALAQLVEDELIVKHEEMGTYGTPGVQARA